MTNATLHHQRGLSIVELMVGIAIGLFIVAAATMVVTTQLNDNRLLLLQTQLQQDLRATADIITRELRRAGSVGNTSLAQDSIWQSSGIALQENPFVGVGPFETFDEDEVSSEVTFRYRRAPGSEGPFGFILAQNANGAGVIKTQMAGSGLQDLTDPQVMDVIEFTITPVDTEETQIPCPRLCADGSTDCWPTLTVRNLAVSITAASRADPQIVRTIQSRVRLRNDWLKFNDPGPGGQACPQ